MHQVYLSLGSNIQPEVNLSWAVELLQEHGEVRRVSKAWESEAVGSDGPNFLNACVLFVTPHSQAEVKGQIIHSIEARLGRKRSADKYAPRTIDIDIVLFDEHLCDEKFWRQAFVVIPLAEIHPEYRNPITQEDISHAVELSRQNVWMEARPEVLGRFNRASPSS
ncbi:MAG TPA: 2-amino-4-hydroxy-6-hydroxymethyldihydropteridine diphosphokinase [Anaerolineales bacterium]|nr:2-amino-4-hydroxy-6-hydroxymethyldihydropteridine diphosphokinase [Anaerolineales bacterium]